VLSENKLVPKRVENRESNLRVLYLLELVVMHGHINLVSQSLVELLLAHELGDSASHGAMVFSFHYDHFLLAFHLSK
jgi:hypothetical protein